MDAKICAVVVTYNRKELLLHCLAAIKKQTYIPHTVLIVDNASSDGTQNLIESSGYYNTLIDGIHFKYILLPSNQGGAGGFYNGMKAAYDSAENFDGVWVMDDDGMPDSSQLEKLLEYFPQYDYLAPLVLSKDDKEKLAFNYKGAFSLEQIKRENDKVVNNYACPFNGILYSRKLIEKIGFPIPNLFIWGDERNYDQRAKDAGFIPHTILEAVHVHPSDKLTFGKSVFSKTIVLVPNKWKGYCFWRNTIFNAKGHFSLKNYLAFFFYYGAYYLLIKKSISWFYCFTKAYFSGFKKKPDLGFKKYMK